LRAKRHPGAKPKLAAQDRPGLANYIAEDIDTLQAEVERSLTAKRRSVQLLRSFFKHAELSV